MTTRGHASRRKPVNIAEAKARLPELIERAASGEEIVISRNGTPRARLVHPAYAKGREDFENTQAGAGGEGHVPAGL